MRKGSGIKPAKIDRGEYVNMNFSIAGQDRHEFIHSIGEKMYKRNYVL